jgi:hypothetical protein
MNQTAQGPNKKRSEDADERMIEGAAAIAEFIYRSREPRYLRKIYYLVQNSKIPIMRMGSRLCMRPSTYKSWIEDQEARSVKNANPNAQASVRKDVPPGEEPQWGG